VISLETLPLGPSDVTSERDEPIVREFDELALTIEEPSSCLLPELGEQFGDGEERWWFPVNSSMPSEEVDQAILDESLVDSMLFGVRVGIVEGEVRDGFGGFCEIKSEGGGLAWSWKPPGVGKTHERRCG